MSLTKDSWNEIFESRLANWDKQVSRTNIKSIYAYISALLISPLAEAFQRGDFSTLIVLGRLLPEGQEDIIINLIQNWNNLITASERIGDVIGKNTDLRDALDLLLIKFNAIELAQNRLSQEQQNWFINKFREEVQSYGNWAKFDLTLTKIAKDMVLPSHTQNVEVQQVNDSTIIAGNNNQVSYLVNYYSEKNRPQKEALSEQVTKYLKWVQERFQFIELRGIKRDGQQIVQLSLDKVYVPLEARYDVKWRKEIALNELLSLGTKFIISGGPGSGKTTVVQHIAWILSTAILANNSQLAHDKLKYPKLSEMSFNRLITIGKRSKIISSQRINELEKLYAEKKAIEESLTIASQKVDSLVPNRDLNILKIEKISIEINVIQEKRNKNKNEIDANKRALDLLKKKNSGLAFGTLFKEPSIKKQYDMELSALSNAIKLLEITHISLMKEIDALDSAKISMVEDLKNINDVINSLTIEQKKLEKKLSDVDDVFVPSYKRAIKELDSFFNNNTPLPIPIYVPLNLFAFYLSKLSPEASNQEKTLATFITNYQIKRQTYLDLDEKFFANMLNEGEDVILLLDGLDEVPSESGRVKVRQAIEDLSASRENLFVIVTSRTSAYRGRVVLGQGFKEIHVLPLGEQQINALIKQAYESIYPANNNLAKLLTSQLIDQLEKLEKTRQKQFGGQVERLITSPLLVRLLLIVHFNERKLPQQRVDLYRKAVESMLLPEYSLEADVIDEISRRVGGNWEFLQEMLQHVAFHMHKRGFEQGRDILEDDLRRILEEQSSYTPFVADLISLTKQRGTLLEERDQWYRFLHLSFQEYLAARYLSEIYRDVDQIATFFESGILLDSWWREPALLTIGYLNLTSPRIARNLILRMFGLRENGDSQDNIPLDVRLGTATIAITAFAEWQSQLSDIIELVKGKIESIISGSSWPEQIQAIHSIPFYESVAQFGDPRFNDLKWFLPKDNLLGFVEIPSGKFTMGSSFADKDAVDCEFPQHELFLPKFYIARFPVTNIQFKTFIKSTNYKENFRGYDEFPTFPVGGITWKDALAYCHWLTDALCHSDSLPEPLASLIQKQGWQITLPSEAEWEKAARGMKYQIYPWGNEFAPNKANTLETGWKNFAPVGCFRLGVSPFGVDDLSGNIWEWTRTLWKNPNTNELYQYPYDKNDGRENPSASDEIPRILRGGSFDAPARSSRCAARLWGNPNNDLNTSGFRIALVNPDVLRD